MAALATSVTEVAEGLCTYLDASPSPFHAVAEMVRRLTEAGFTPLDERERWTLAPGDQRYVVRDGGSLIAVRVGSAPLPEAGVRLVGTHTDSPTFKVRPRYDVERGDYRLVGVEPYGGLLAHTWLDRELTVAGRLAVRGSDGSIGMHLVTLPGGPVRLDRHRTPCAWHLDVQYAALAPAGAVEAISEESLDVAWWPVHSLPNPELEPFVAHALARWS